MSETCKPVSKKKVIKRVLIGLVIFIVFNFIGAAVGTSVSITHPKRETYDDRITYTKSKDMWGSYDEYDKQDYIVKGLDDYELRVTSVTSDTARGTGKYVIISHGQKSNHYGVVKYIEPYIELGFTCIIYDLRAHGANADAICSMGGYEAVDLNYLIEDTCKRFGDVKTLGLQGESMGSSASLNVLKYTDKVDFIVSDCGFESLKYMVHDMYNDMYMYPFGTCADIGFKVLYGINTSEVSGIDALKGKGVPVLFVHGEGDSWIDIENSKDMYEENKKYAYSELWIVPGAGHAASRDVAGKDAYKSHIESFLDKAGVIKKEITEQAA
jgi:pimeloyl-ACP methyl ester carboxylesterase